VLLRWDHLCRHIFNPSSSAKADDPVRRGFPAGYEVFGLLDHRPSRVMTSCASYFM
jgi:hypothetical protein